MTINYIDEWKKEAERQAFAVVASAKLMPPEFSSPYLRNMHMVCKDIASRELELGATSNVTPEELVIEGLLDALEKFDGKASKEEVDIAEKYVVNVLRTVDELYAAFTSRITIISGNQGLFETIKAPKKNERLKRMESY